VQVLKDKGDKMERRLENAVEKAKNASEQIQVRMLQGTYRSTLNPEPETPNKTLN
jgi:hypothetical protein